MFSQVFQKSFKESIFDNCNCLQSKYLRGREREAGREIKRKTMIKGLSLLCCWMFSIFCEGKGMHRLVNRRHRCMRGSSLIERNTEAQEGQTRCTDTSQGYPRSTTNEKNPPLHCSPVIAVSLICPPASCLRKKKKNKSAVS